MKNLSKPIKIIGICLYAVVFAFAILQVAAVIFNEYLTSETYRFTFASLFSGGLWLFVYLPLFLFAGLSALGIFVLWDLTDGSVFRVIAAFVPLFLKALIVGVLMFFRLALWFGTVVKFVDIAMACVMGITWLFELGVWFSLMYKATEKIQRPEMSLGGKIAIGVMQVVTLFGSVLFDYFAETYFIMTAIFACASAAQIFLYHLSVKTGRWNAGINAVLSAVKGVAAVLTVLIASVANNLFNDGFLIAMWIVMPILAAATSFSEIALARPAKSIRAPEKERQTA